MIDKLLALISGIMIGMILYTELVGPLVRPYTDEASFTNGFAVGVRTMRCINIGEISGKLKDQFVEDIIAHRHELARSHTCDDLKPFMEK